MSADNTTTAVGAVCLPGARFRSTTALCPRRGKTPGKHRQKQDSRVSLLGEEREEGKESPLGVLAVLCVWVMQGDGDPIDAVEVGNRPCRRGQVVVVRAAAYPGTIVISLAFAQVKVVGVLALVDQGETDWKVITLAVDDSVAASVDGASDADQRDGTEKDACPVLQTLRISMLNFPGCCMRCASSFGTTRCRRARSPTPSLSANARCRGYAWSVRLFVWSASHRPLLAGVRGASDQWHPCVVAASTRGLPRSKVGWEHRQPLVPLLPLSVWTTALFPNATVPAAVQLTFAIVDECAAACVTPMRKWTARLILSA